MADPRPLDPRPASAVSHGVGLAGLAGLAAWIIVARYFGMDGPLASLVAVAACALPMVGWSLAVDRVHRRASTGIDWDRSPAPWRETLPVSLVKLAGLWVTWGLIALFYGAARWYWTGAYPFAMDFLAWALPWLAALSIPYVLWLDRRLVAPRDGAFAFGALLMGDMASVDRAALAEHGRSWAVKGFFTAFMISIVPGNWTALLHADPGTALHDPLALAKALIAAMFLIDVAFATGGYLLTLRPLDAHIRSANPFVAGWAAALLCYPPLNQLSPSPFDYHLGTADWSWWLAGHPIAIALLGALLVALTGVYAWATVAFGIRFSNLTNRGILTHGPYRWTKHPAYVSKTLFWWGSALPFLTVSGSWSEGARNCVALAALTAVYYWRARTEERHLMADPAYAAYAAWMARNAPLPRLLRSLRDRRTAGALQPAE